MRRSSRLQWRILGALALALPLLACPPDSDELRLVGSVERTHLELVATASEVIVELPIARGEHVAEGQLLARLDATVAEAETASAEAAVAGARTSARLAELELKRLTRLRREGVASQQDLESAELRKAEADAGLRETTARLRVARKRVDDLTLRAPSAGVVDQIPFELGERVPAGAVLVVVQSEALPWVRIWVPEHEVPLVHPGTKAEIRIDGLGIEVLHGRVLDVAREPAYTPHYALTERDREYLVYEARVEIEDAPESLRPGVPADVTLRVEPMIVSADHTSADG